MVTKSRTGSDAVTIAILEAERATETLAICAQYLPLSFVGRWVFADALTAISRGLNVLRPEAGLRERVAA